MYSRPRKFRSLEVSAVSYEQLQQMYAGDEYYWGREPNDLARRSLELLSPDATGGLRAVNIGAGEGRDAVLFAVHGLEALAIDLAPNGLRKAVRLTREKGVDLRVDQGDVNTLSLLGTFDLVYSIGTIQYVEPANRRAWFDHLKEHTAAGGINALFAFIEDPKLSPAPDWGTDEYLYAPGELRDYYAEWSILYSRSFTFDDDSGGVPHQHAAEEYVFLKPPAE